MESTLFLARSAFPVTAAAGGKDARFRFAATGLPRTVSAPAMAPRKAAVPAAEAGFPIPIMWYRST
ncbi:hypothetical protein MUK42_15663 [Musa troglodytarum]|uniref:Uncharacterized protein n=1 Tax=Musa troglodytarum TaxID=320322 RepID=A0A9E7KSI0_9LILI|nr:hypothetical protein MUK42_15663 [Musa troglodytarum]